MARCGNRWRIPQSHLALYADTFFLTNEFQRARTMSAFQFIRNSLKSPSRSKQRQKAVTVRATPWRRSTLEMLEAREMMTFLTPTSLPVGAGAAGIAVGDYNADGEADMAVVDQTSASINLLASNGDGTFQNAGSYAAGTGAIDAAFGDFNADGKNDLAVASTSGIVNVLLGNGVVSASDYVTWRHSKGASVTAGT